MPKKPPQSPVTPEDAEKFALFMRKWQVLLNLMDWRYVRDRRASKYMAEITSQETEHRLVKWRLGTDWGNTPVTDESLESTAIHENLHVLLHTLVERAIAEGEVNDNVMAEEHRVIAVLEKLLGKLAVLADPEAE
jgi:hypothetical protein